MNRCYQTRYDKNVLFIIIIVSNIVNDDIVLFISSFNFHINETIKSTAFHPDNLQ